MQDQKPPSPQGQLQDPEFRAAMLTKLEGLLAVLEIARNKADDGLTTRPQDSVRLIRLQDNLDKTLQVCRQARRMLIRLNRAEESYFDEFGYRQFIESASFHEFVKMRSNDPIEQEEIREVDLEHLCQVLTED
ncbi:MAG: hypothetical protein HQ519_04995 [Planctomycetes bacterium]|nr:hypothetical protein [Planctomycetota bacterium]